MEKEPKIMAILNVTPDSFSDGGQFNSPDLIERQVEIFLKEGADIIDVGGESTRPFAKRVSIEEELNRVLPAIQIIRSMSSIPISIDTTKADVAREALALGADIINDISALRYDTEMIKVVQGCDAPLVIMHMKGTPENMQLDPHYENVVDEINQFFSERLEWLEENGVTRNRVTLDPGIGFGKTMEHNIEILGNISRFRQHGCPVLVGHSRKSFLAHLFDAPMNERDNLTAVVSALCCIHGASILRVHSVKQNLRAVKLAGMLHKG